MNVFWIGLVGGQARSHWGTIPLVRRIFFVLFQRKCNCSIKQGP